METDANSFPHGDITYKIIGAAFEVWKTLGYGFLEMMYENALAIELRDLGYTVEQQDEIEVIYKGRGVGLYKPDLVVDNKVIIELKAAKEYERANEAQLLNYLKATGIAVGVHLNFGKSKCEHKRMVFSQHLLPRDSV